MRAVALGSHHRDWELGQPELCMLNKMLEPLLQSIERFLACDIIHHNARISTSVVLWRHIRHLSFDLVPDLHLNNPSAIQVDLLQHHTQLDQVTACIHAISSPCAQGLVAWLVVLRTQIGLEV